MTGEHKQINKSAIRNFSIQARNILMKSAVTEAGFYGVTKDQIKNPIQKGPDFEVYETLAGTEKRIFGSDIRRRANLVAAIRQKGFDEVIEETAYTWFNRLIAIRFMEINKYLPFRTRVLSSDAGSITPDIVSRFMDLDLHMIDEEVNDVQKAKEENRFDEAFRLLFIKVCNELNDILPGLFEKTDDYMELLLRLPYTSDGVVRMLVDTIPESNFNVNEGGQVEIIGWLYQYYNTEPKAKAFAKKGKITKEEIPAVTQLFTPDWIVRYMVENSLGRLWIEHLVANGDDRSEQEIANDFGWKYYLPEAEQEPEVAAQLVQIRAERKDLTPEEILCIDPCQGSGHILVYLFDVLMQIYREEGYSERDAARSILENNLYGLDIDDRAYQLSYFAVLMKAREYDRMILKKHIEPHVYSIQESNTIDRNQFKYFGADMSEFVKNNATKQLARLLDTFIDAKEYGSILNVDSCDWELLREFVENDRVKGQFAFDAIGIEQTQKQILRLIDIGKVMGQKYHIATTNPPYMGNMPQKLSAKANREYSKYKYDLFAMFIYQGLNYIKNDGYIAMVTGDSWLTIASFEAMRHEILNNASIINLIELGIDAFEAGFGTTVFTLSHRYFNYVTYYGNISANKDKKEALFHKESLRLRKRKAYDFDMIPYSEILVDASDRVLQLLKIEKSNTVLIPKAGIVAGDNDRYIRLWHEVDIGRISFDCEAGCRLDSIVWVPLHKGGGFRKFYGMHDYIIRLKLMLNERTLNKSIRTGDEDYYFREGITWSALSNNFGVRKSPKGFVYNTTGSMCFIKGNIDLDYIVALFNSKVAKYILEILAPNLHFNPGTVVLLPFIYENVDQIKALSLECLNDSIDDWDSLESSWNFKRHPLVPAFDDSSRTTISRIYEQWKKQCTDRFNSYIQCEEEINRLFIDLYGLKGELSPEIEVSEVNLNRGRLGDTIRTFISYAVGCMLGRYSLDIEGLAYAGGDWQEALSTKYKTFLPDEDAIIPITDEEYFKDDIVARFMDFVRTVYGEETLEENLKFIADALGNKGDTSRAVIRNYFLNDFYKDHCNTYSVTGSGKRPIYWLFDSGKQNGFKALIYIHRYTPDTVGLIRSKYLHNAQAAIQNALQNSEYIIASTSSATERARETKKRDKYVKQLNELRPYYQALTHIALLRIPMDLDDGVKKNYQLFQNVEISTEGKKKQSINLLAKI